jgi:hypothetical protein
VVPDLQPLAVTSASAQARSGTCQTMASTGSPFCLAFTKR